MIDWQRMYHTTTGVVLHPGTPAIPVPPTLPPQPSRIPPRGGGAGATGVGGVTGTTGTGGVTTTQPPTSPPQPSTTPPAATVKPIVPIAGLYSTGFDARGLPLADGTTDPHWTIIATPTGSGGLPAYATVNRWPVGNPWVANSATSRWISPSAAYVVAAVVMPVAAPIGDAPGNYTYRTTFDLTGFDPTSARITASVAADDALADVLLNGQSLGLTANGFSAFTPLAISGAFLPGANTLDFVVTNLGNAPNPSGLRVDISTAAAPTVVDEMKQCPRCGQTIAMGYVVKPVGPGFMLYSPACGFLKYRLAP